MKAYTCQARQVLFSNPRFSQEPACFTAQIRIILVLDFFNSSKEQFARMQLLLRFCVVLGLPFSLINLGHGRTIPFARNAETSGQQQEKPLLLPVSPDGLSLPCNKLLTVKIYCRKHMQRLPRPYAVDDYTI